MSILKGLTRRAIVAPFLRDDNTDGNTPAGQYVDRESALGLAAVWACVRLLTNTVATLPVDAYYRYNGVRRPILPRPGWIDTPVPLDPNVTRSVHFTQVMTSLLLDGNAFIMVAPSKANPSALYVLDPRMVEIKGTMAEEPWYEVRTDRPGQKLELGVDDIIHIPFLTLPNSRRGFDPISAFRQTIGHGLAVEEFGSRFFGEGATMSGVIEMPGPPPAQSVIDQLRSDFKRKNQGRRNSHAVGILTGGAKFTQLTISPENAQFIETARWSVEQVARLFGVPPHMIGATESQASYASVEQKAMEYVTFSVTPYVQRIEAAYSQIVPGTGGYIKFNLDALQRGDIQTRYAAYGIGTQSGFLLFDDVREKEDMLPLPGGDVQRVPLANSDPATADLNQKVKALESLVRSGFDPVDAAKVAGLPPMKHTGLASVQLQPPTEPAPSEPEDTDD